ncbi:MAG: hypothetical protein AB1453_05040 [Chloroflexota bacterium]
MEIPRHWRLKKQRYAPQGEVCPHREGKIFPPRGQASRGGSEAGAAYTFSGKGAVYSFTRVGKAP